MRINGYCFNYICIIILLLLVLLPTSSIDANNCNYFRTQFETIYQEDSTSNIRLNILLDSIKKIEPACILLQSDVLFQMARNRLGEGHVGNETINLYKESLDKRKEIKIQDSTLVRIYNNIATCYDYSTRPDLAFSYANAAVLYYQEEYNINLFVGSMLLCASSQIKYTDYQGAYADLKKIETVWDNEDVDSDYELSWYTNIADVYQRMDSLDKAIFYYEKMLDKYKEGYGILYAVSNLPDLYREKKLYTEALDYANMLEGFLKRDKELENIWSRRYNSILGRIYDDQGLMEKAILYQNKALECSQTYESQTPDYIIHENIAAIYNDIGQLDKALHHYHLSLLAMIPNYETDDELIAPSIGNDFYVYCLNDIVETLLGKSNVLYELFQKTEDESYLYASTEHFKVLKILFSYILEITYFEESQLLWTSKVKHSFEKAIAANFELYERTGDSNYLNELFEYVEQSKAIVLHQNLKNIDALKSTEKAIQKKLNTQKWKIHELEISFLMSNDISIKKEISIAKQNLRNSIKELEETDEQYYKMKYAGNDISISKVQKGILNENQVLLEIFEGENDVYSIWIDKTTANVERKEITKEYTNNVEEYYQYLNDKESNLEEYSKVAYYLYDFFFAREIEKHEGKEFIIIPDGNIAKIPFGSFLSASFENDFTYQTAPYLLDKINVNYAYAAKTLLRNDNNIDASKGLIIVPDYYDTDEPSLKVAEEEGNYLYHNIKSKILSGNNVSKASCIKEFSRPYSFIHLAMHAGKDKASSLKNKLIFVGRDDENNDLTVKELYDIELKTNFVYLNACSTGAGDILEGEGIISLARAFKYAGCSNLITHLWEGNDKASFGISKTFYDNILEGKNIGEALNVAKREYIRNEENETFAHPYYWAGVIGIGPTNFIKMEQASKISTKMIILFGLLGLLLTVLGFLLFRFSQNRNKRT